MGQNQALPLTHDENTRIREYSVYCALFLTLYPRASARNVQSLTPEQLVAMLQARRALLPPPPPEEPRSSENRSRRREMPTAAESERSNMAAAGSSRRGDPSSSSATKLPDLERMALEQRQQWEQAAVCIQRRARGRSARAKSDFHLRQWSSRDELRKSSSRQQLVEHPGRERLSTPKSSDRDATAAKLDRPQQLPNPASEAPSMAHNGESLEA